MMNSTISNPGANCTIQPNSDIIGIGIRVSIYVLSLAGPLISTLALSEELLDAVEGSLGITGLALFLTTVISAAQDTLDLFHAICLFHLVGLVGISFRAHGKHDGEKSQERRIVSLVFFYLASTGFLAFMLYLFATAPHFGPTPMCNDNVIYVMYGVDIQATNPVFRGIFLFSLGIGMVGIIIGVLMQFGIFSSYEPAEGINLYSVIGDVAGRAYVIAMLELIIKRNDLGPGIATWGFGQLLAMLMLIGPLIQLISLKNHRDNDDPFAATSSEELPIFLVNIVMSILDLGGNAAAGAAAAATGAHVNGSLVTTKIVNLGALVGVLSAGILSYTTLVRATSGFSIGTLLSFVLSTFGMSFVVTAFVAQKLLAETPNSLLIAAVAAGAPLLAGNAFQSPADVSAQLSLFSIGWDALSGYTFARVTFNYGYDLCTFNAAAAAGAAFGVVITFWKLPYHLLIRAILEDD